tara:strand:+ start:13686 stop:14666 length:981 start_codon:yes stop_codon:yes gene_type:complete
LTNYQEIKDIAIETLELESKSILKLSEIIDDNFCELINILKDFEGRIIITGIGKSAIIGMKISATLNSTGSKSIFLNLGDALHGDLGVIDFKDIVICISKSGESAEIESLSIFLKKNKIKLVGISCNKNSMLKKLSDIFILTEIEKEACHNNLAPTTSSTCHLAIGDAIAMTLQKIKGFTPEKFSNYHPSGSIGKHLNLTLESLVDESRIPLVKPDAPFFEIIEIISSNMYGATAVVEKNMIIGIITDGDIRRLLEKKQTIENTFALNFMTKNPQILHCDTLAYDALKHIKKNNISQVLVKNDDNVYMGIVHILDIIKQGISDEQY